MTLAVATKVADAVLWEGYLLYPYRATAAKNQVRWQFGMVGPPGAVEAGAGEEPTMRLEVPVRFDDADARVDIQLRFLQVQLRTVERARGDGYEETDELTIGPATWIRWHEAIERTHDVSFDRAELLGAGTIRVDVDVDGGSDVEILTDERDRPAGRLVRTRFGLRGRLEVAAREPEAAHDPTVRILRVELINTTAWSAVGADDRDRPRDIAARSSYVGVHLILVAASAALASLADPPAWATAIASECRNHRCWPVLIGPEGSDDTVLASPIILSDHPEIAPESPGDLYDATEIDEILTLRIMTMTDDEKRAARGTDPRAGAIIDRSDALPPDVLDRLHGALRGLDDVAGARHSEINFDDVATYGTAPWWNPAVDAAVSPESDVVMINGVEVAKGSRVRLRPSGRADAQDIFLDGLTALVTGVYFDVDGDTHVAVVVEDDPAAELHEWYGRYSYFRPDEIVPLPAASDSVATP